MNYYPERSIIGNELLSGIKHCAIGSVIRLEILAGKAFPEAVCRNAD